MAFLRGVSPLNCKMAALQRAFAAEFSDVRTVLASGNVVFSAPPATEAALARRAEAAMTKHLGKSFFTIVRSVASLQKLLASDPYAGHELRPGSKCVVTFLSRKPKTKPKFPIQESGARLLAGSGAEVFTAYVAGPDGPVFMRLLERTFGKDITTRSWDTVGKVAK